MKVVDILNKHTNKGDYIMGTIAQDFIDQGVNIGKAEGRAEGKAQVAKKLLLQNVPADEVADVTDLCINQVLAIARKI
jgi:hypothetical protein